MSQDAEASPLVVLLVAAAITSGVKGAPESALDVCRRMLTWRSSTPTLPKIPVLNTGKQGEDFLFFDTRSPTNYTLTNALRLNSISPVYETSRKTTICVGLVDTTSYTYMDGLNDPVAWVTIHTRAEQSAGLMHVDTACWRENKHFAGCNPSFVPLPFIVNLPQYHYSILEEEFWTNFTSTRMEISDSWIWKINTQTMQRNVKPNWLFKMDIPSIEVLKILGNDWKKPENLLRPLPKLISLDLSYNNLEVVPPDTLLEMPHLENIILGHNNISEYPKEVKKLNLHLMDLTNPLGNTVLKIDDNDIKSLPHTLQILGLENTKLDANVTRILLHPQLYFLNLSGCSLGKMPDYDFVNETEGNVSSKLEIMDLSLNKLGSLPVAVFMKLKNLRILILHHNNLTSWLAELDMREALTNLILSNNIICNITVDTFAELHKMKRLDISRNCIENIPAKTFMNNKNLQNIDISHNRISYIDTFLFSNLRELKEIKISHNFLKSFPALMRMDLNVLDLSFNALTKFENCNATINYVDISHNSVTNLNISFVEKLNMSYTNISVIPPLMWENMKSLKEVDLGGNEFECCLFGNYKYIKDIVATQIKNLGSYNPLTCSVNKTSAKILLRTFVYNETVCSLTEQSDSTLGLETFLPLGMIFLAICIVAIMLYVYRFELTYLSHLFQMKKVGDISDEERYKNCVYDAFVCYSAKNFAWVAGRLLPALERPPYAYRLCVHDRDFALGTAIHRNIVASLEKSRKVILVLSSDFIASKWCQWELEMANHKMFEENRNSIVLVELEPLERQSLPRHLRYLMARTTYLQWPLDGDPWGQLPAEVNLAFDGAEGDGWVEAVLDAKAQKSEKDGDRDWRRQRMLRREEACLKRLREALGQSLNQRRGTNTQRVPHTVLDAC